MNWTHYVHFSFAWFTVQNNLYFSYTGASYSPSVYLGYENSHLSYHPLSEFHKQNLNQSLSLVNKLNSLCVLLVPLLSCVIQSVCLSFSVVYSYPSILLVCYLALISSRVCIAPVQPTNCQLSLPVASLVHTVIVQIRSLLPPTPKLW